LLRQPADAQPHLPGMMYQFAGRAEEFSRIVPRLTLGRVGRRYVRCSEPAPVRIHTPVRRELKTPAFPEELALSVTRSVSAPPLHRSRPSPDFPLRRRWRTLCRARL